MHTHTLKSLGLMALAIAAMGPAQAVPPLKPFPVEGADTTNGPVSAWLEKRFSTMLGICLPQAGGIEMATNGLWPTVVKLSSIPKPIVDVLSLTATSPTFRRYGSGTVTRVFGYIYSDQEQMKPAFNLPRFLLVDYQHDKDQITETGIPELHRDVTCTNALELAVKTNNDFHLTPATLSAAGTAAYNKRFNEEIHLAYGTFSSPIAAMWFGPNGNGDRKGKFFAAITFWDWYNRNHPAATEKFHIMTSIVGYSLYHATDTGADTDLVGNFKGAAGLPFLTAEPKIDDKFHRQTTLSISDPEFLLDQVKDPAFDDFPSLDTVIAAISDNVRFNPQVSPDSLHPNEATPFYVDIYDLPFAYCGANYNITGKDMGSVTLSGPPSNQTPPDKEPYCRVPLTFNPGAFTGNDSINIAFALTYKSPNAGVKAFSIPLGASFAKTDRPSLKLTSAHEAIPNLSGPGNAELSWLLRFRLIDDGVIADQSQVNVSDISADCPDAVAIADVVPEVRLPPRNATGQRPLELILTAHSNIAIATPYTTVKTCPVSGNIVYTIKGKTYVREIPQNISIQVPSIN